MKAHERVDLYDKDHCWQYDIRQKNLEEDLSKSQMTYYEAATLTVDDFVFSYVDANDKTTCQEIKQFIQDHEWLGTIPNRPTHRFTVRTKKYNELAGVAIYAVPNTFSNLLGEGNKHREKLLSRGACISWAPKHLGSFLVMNSIRYMAKNTDFCFFTAYSDPEARELGTIYQACNWTYLGQTSGTASRYFDPEHPEYGWFSGRNFRHRSKYNRYAKELGIEILPEWWGKYTPDWTKIPEHISSALKAAAKAYQARCVERKSKPKHKYVYILGEDKRETKKLKKLFAELNPGLVNLPYPKSRGK